MIFNQLTYRDSPDPDPDLSRYPVDIVDPVCGPGSGRIQNHWIRLGSRSSQILVLYLNVSNNDTEHKRILGSQHLTTDMNVK